MSEYSAVFNHILKPDFQRHLTPLNCTLHQVCNWAMRFSPLKILGHLSQLSERVSAGAQWTTKGRSTPFNSSLHRAGPAIGHGIWFKDPFLFDYLFNQTANAVEGFLNHPKTRRVLSKFFVHHSVECLKLIPALVEQ